MQNIFQYSIHMVYQPIGKAFTGECSPFSYNQELAFQLDIAADEIEDFMTAMKSIVNMPVESILQILCVVNYILSGEQLNVSDISIYDKEQKHLKSALENRRVQSRIVYDSSALAPHNTMAVEETLMSMISHGNVTALCEWL